MPNWIRTLLNDPDMLQMGHGQSAADENLGLGFVYYGLVRALRPGRAVVIGSWRGFVPIVLGRAILDNGGDGEVVFIDPSMVDDFWTDEDRVRQHFTGHGVPNIRHFQMTTQQFVASPDFHALAAVGLLFIDGMHTAEQARFDYESFAPRLSAEGIVLFHDSVRIRESRIYGTDRPYEHRVKDFIDDLRRDARLELFDLAVDGGVTLLRRRT